MRTVRLSFVQMLRFVRSDMMLLVSGVSPVLIGAAIRFGIPCFEKILIRATGLEKIMSPYYSLFDILFAAITPVIFCFVAAMVMLEEHDDHIDRYLFVTSLGRRGYFFSRIVIPALAAFAITAILLPIFRLSDLSAAKILILSLAGTLQGIIIALMVVALSSNKLEGMALTKLSSLLMFGVLAPYFIPKPYSYLLFFMPSYWTGMLITEDELLFVLPIVAVSAIWIVVLWRKYRTRF